MSKEALVELVKSFGRFIYFGVLGLVGVWLMSLVASGSLNNVHIVVAGQTINAGLLLVAVVGGIAKAIDRYIHANPNNQRTGITPF